MTEPTPSPKSTDKARRNMQRKKTRRQVLFKATVQNGHVHLQASAPTKWLYVLRWVILVILIALTIHFMPELWQAIQTAIQTVPK